MAYGQVAGFSIFGSRVQNQWVAPRWTQPFILPQSMELVSGNPGELVVISKLSSRSGSVALRQLNPIHIFVRTNLRCLLWLWKIARNIANSFKKLFGNEIICNRIIKHLLKI